MHMVSRQVSLGDGAAALFPGGTESSQLMEWANPTSLTEVASINESTLATIIARALKKVTEQGIDYVVVLMVPLVIFCALSWSLSLPGAIEWLALLVMSVVAVARILWINRSNVEQEREKDALKVDNDTFRKSNEELKSNVNKLETQTKIFENQNAKLEEIHKLLALHSIKSDRDLRSCLREFQIGLNEQRHLLQEIRLDNQHRRNLVEMELRSKFVNMFLACSGRGREIGIRANKFLAFSSMVASDHREVLASLLTFESIDSNRDGVIDMQDMHVWVPKAVQKLIEIDEGTADSDFSHAKLPAESHIAVKAFAAGHTAYLSSTQSMASTAESFVINVDDAEFSRESTSRSTRSV